MLKKLLFLVIGFSTITYAMTEPANAAAEDTVYVFNTLLFLIGGWGFNRLRQALLPNLPPNPPL